VGRAGGWVRWVGTVGGHGGRGGPIHCAHRTHPGFHGKQFTNAVFSGNACEQMCVVPCVSLSWRELTEAVSEEAQKTRLKNSRGLEEECPEEVF
jgi:hypothetical protein